MPSGSNQQPGAGTAPVSGPPPYPGYYPGPPTTLPVPPSPPPTGPFLPTSTIMVGPVTTTPQNPTVPSNDPTGFACTASVALSSQGSTPIATVTVRDANLSAAWVVAVWSTKTLEKGVALTNGQGSTAFVAPSRAEPKIYVFADSRKRPADRGCGN